jgi:hypothetical protein
MIGCRLESQRIAREDRLPADPAETTTPNETQDQRPLARARVNCSVRVEVI